MKFPIRETILAVFACFLWSTAFVGIKIGLPYTTPLNFAGQRFMLAGIITLIFAGNYRANFRSLKSHFFVVVKVGFLQTFLLYLLFYLGLNRISGALGAVVTGFTPLWAIVLAHFFMANDRITPSKAISFVLGVIGIITVAVSSGNGLGTVDLFGVSCMIGSSLVSAISAIVVAKDNRTVPAIPLNGAQLFVGGTLLLLVSFATETVSVIPDPRYFGALLYLSILSATAYSIWFHLLHSKVKISFLNLWKFIIPVFGAILSWLILPNESPTAMAVVGMILVGAAIIIYYARKEPD